MRWLVGDVQGCFREFETLLREIRFDPDRDELWCLGDLVNRGPDSLAAVRLWRDLGGKGLIGNHEIHALRVRSGAVRKPLPALETFFSAPDADELLGLLRGLPVLVHLPSAGKGPDAWIVHAGLHPRWTDLAAVAADLNEGVHDDRWLASEGVSFATSVRCCDETGSRCKHAGPPEDCPDGFLPWNEFYRGDTLVVHGHWARRGFYREGNVLGLDSGCVYGGPLTAWCQDEDRVVQVACRS